MTSFVHSGSAARRAFPVAREGYPLIGAAAFVAAIVAVFGLPPLLAMFFGAIALFFAMFFRDPERVVPQDETAVVSPADGKVVEVQLVRNSDFAHEEMLKISVFMSVFNVHVNRVPAEGKVTEVIYYPGKFFSANLDKASRDNERNAVMLKMRGGRKLIVVQVAGLIARRIICRVRAGDALRRGERFGMICFGSRLDIYLPPDIQPVVSVGDKVLAGESILGHLTD